MKAVEGGINKLYNPLEALSILEKTKTEEGESWGWGWGRGSLNVMGE